MTWKGVFVNGERSGAVPIETTTKEPSVMQGTMWAIQKAAPGPGLKPTTVPIPSVGPSDVRIRVTAFAIC